ncbi:MAG: hypothetical protein K2N18_00335 [Clostridia bacterium]|nr:hypothetical protein [Clostridia bacterium]
MKGNKFWITILAVAVIALGVFMIFDMEGAERRLCDAGVYDILTPELVEMYEREIAGESIVSNKTPSQLERSAGRLGVDLNKLKAIMLIQDLASKVDRDISLNELAAMNDMKLLSFAKQCAEKYSSTLSEERIEELKKMISGAVKIPVVF